MSKTNVVTIDTPALQLTLNFAANVAHLRELRGMTIEALCKKAGISRGGYHNIVSGNNAPTLTTVAAVAEAFGVSPAVLIS